MSSDNSGREDAGTAHVKNVAALEQENKRLNAEIERVNRERIEYLQNVSHQLVAPLNAIKWHI